MKTFPPSSQHAIALFREGNLAGAEQACHELLAAADGGSDRAVALHLLGVIAASREDDAAALEWFNRAIEHQPEYGYAWGDRAKLWERRGDLEQARRDYEAAVAREPEFFEACFNLSGIYRKQDRFEEAYRSSQQAIDCNPAAKNAHFQHALNCELLGYIDQAIDHYSIALELAPDFVQARANRALCKLLVGRFEDAWEDYAFRDQFREAQLRPASLFAPLGDTPAWDGSPLAGKTLLVYGDQGIGDEILFASCFRELMDQGARLLIVCDPRLAPLFARSFPEATVIGHVLKGTEPVSGLPEGIDYQIPSGHLPRFLRCSQEDFSAATSPFLLADPRQVEAWRARYDALGPGPKIGISWRAGGEPRTQRRRTTELVQWLRLLQLPRVQFIDIQYGETVEEREQLHRQHGLRVHHFPEADPLVDMDGFSAKLAALDGVISVGNATVHTAGALGLETLALLPKVPVWRWMIRGDRSLWYPSVELLRQQEWYEWETVFSKAEQWLSLRLGRHGNPAAVASLAVVAEPPVTSPVASRGVPDDKRTIEELYEEAQRLHHSNQVAEAEATYLQIVRRAPRHADSWNLAGVAAHQQGRHEIALDRIGRAIEMAPGVPTYLFNRACVESAMGAAEAAIATYRKLLEIDPAHVQSQHNLGVLLAARGELADAVAAYDAAIAADPRCLFAHANRGIALQRLGWLDDARSALRTALSIDPNCLPAQKALAETEAQLAQVASPPVSMSDAETETTLQRALAIYGEQRYDEAQEIVEHVLQSNPRQVDALRLSGVIHRKQGNYEQAIGILSRAVELSPNSAELHFELGSALRLAERTREALDCFRRAAELDPQLQPAFLNAGGIYETWEQYDEALPWQQEAVRLKPDCPLARYNLGNCLMKTGDCEAALEQYQQSVELDPGYAKAHWNLGMCHLLLGNFAEGWREYEYREAVGEVNLDKYPQPRWRGESLSGKTILLHAEQGIGDEILLASCISDVVARAGKCVVVCEPRLAPLFARSFPKATVYGIRRRNDWAPAELPERIDYQIPIGSLPGLLRTSREAFPQRERYLVPDAERLIAWRNRFRKLASGQQLTIGISWRTGGQPVEQRKRTTELAQWKPLFDLPGIQWVNLQYGDVEDDLRAARRELGVVIHDFSEGDPLIDIDDFAAKVAALDLVISVGNATVHMAGALGVESWCLLPLVPSWRWMIRDERSPWYSCVELIRQPRRGMWAPVFQAVEDKLRRRLALADESAAPTGNPPLVLASNDPPPRGVDPDRDVLDVDEIPRLMAQGIAYHQSGKYTAAEETYRKVLDFAPRHIDALQLLGTLASQTGRTQLAIRSIRRALSVNEANPLLHYNLANSFADQGELDEAVGHYRRAIELQPEFAEALLNLGVALDRKSDRAGAEASYHQALAARPGYPDALRNLALLQKAG